LGPKVSAVYLLSKNLSPKVRTFVDFLSDVISSNPYWEEASGMPRKPR
jgi:LysR family transcriptional regulator for bpeEF and oprC